MVPMSDARAREILRNDPQEEQRAKEFVAIECERRADFEEQRDAAALERLGRLGDAVDVDIDDL